MLAAVDGAFDRVGELIEGVRFKAALEEAMRASAAVNQYVADQAPWALVKNDRDRAATVLYVALRCVDSLKTLFAPFLPFTSQTVHELLGNDGWLAGPLEVSRYTEDDGSAHDVLTGDYTSWVGTWAPSELAAGPAAARAEAALPQAPARDRRRGARAPRHRAAVIDTHAHLDALDDDPADVVARARDAGVTRILTVGTAQAVALAERFESVFADRRRPSARVGHRRRRRDPPPARASEGRRGGGDRARLVP